MLKIDKEFKPSPKLKSLYYTYFALAILVFVLPWLAPIIFFTPVIVSSIISIPIFVILIFTAFWIPKYLDTITYKLTRNEIFWRRGIWFQTTGIVPYNRITNIDINQGPLSRSFGVSSLKIQTAGYSVKTARSAEIRLDGITNPKEVRDFIMDIIDRKKPMAVETFESEDVDAKILNELVKIRKLLKKPSRKK